MRKPIIEEVTNSLSKLPRYSANPVFWRAIKLERGGSALQDFLAKYKKGEVITDNTFISVAPRKEDSFIGRDGYNIEMEIHGKNSSGCRNIHDFAWGKYYEEFLTKSEGLFLPGSKFEVEKIEYIEAYNKYQLILKEL